MYAICGEVIFRRYSISAFVFVVQSALREGRVTCREFKLSSALTSLSAADFSGAALWPDSKAAFVRTIPGHEESNAKLENRNAKTRRARCGTESGTFKCSEVVHGLSFRHSHENLTDAHWLP